MIRLVAILASAAIGAGGAWWAQSLRAEAEINALRTEYATKQAQAVERAHAETIRLQTKADAAARDHAARQAVLANAAARARAERDGLRDDLAAASRSLPDATCAAAREYGMAANIVIGECAARYSEVAEQADRAVGEVMLLRDAWPR